MLTGATGFIGRHCLAHLTAGGFDVHATLLPDEEPVAGDVHWHEADLLDSQSLAKLVAEVQPTHLLHLAWYVDPCKYLMSEQNFRWVQASLSLFDHFFRNGGKRCVGAGTCFEKDWTAKDCFTRDTEPESPAPYCACKRGLGKMLLARGRADDVSTAWGRVFYLYGQHEHPSRLVASVIRSLLKGEPALCSHGNQVRDFMYVDDVAGALVSLLASEVGGTVNIGSGRSLKLKELIGKIAEKVGREELVKLGALEAREGEPAEILADTTVLKDQVGWEPTYSLDAGLDKTIEWWKDHLD
jgi:nucleoside-diphosphate-sugar epimerase